MKQSNYFQLKIFIQSQLLLQKFLRINLLYRNVNNKHAKKFRVQFAVFVSICLSCLHFSNFSYTLNMEPESVLKPHTALILMFISTVYFLFLVSFCFVLACVVFFSLYLINFTFRFYFLSFRLASTLPCRLSLQTILFHFFFRCLEH